MGKINDINCCNVATNSSDNKQKPSTKSDQIKTKNYIIKADLSIPENIIDLDLSNKLIAISDFFSFCKMELPCLENLNLSHNNLSDISDLEKLNSPNLKILDLSYNNLRNLNSFRKFTFPLEQLYLKGNPINEIKIFIEVDILKNLKKLHLCVDDYESNKDDLSSINKTINDFKCEQYKNENENDDIIKKQFVDKKSTLKLSF